MINVDLYSVPKICKNYQILILILTDLVEVASRVNSVRQTFQAHVMRGMKDLWRKEVLEWSPKSIQSPSASFSGRSISWELMQMLPWTIPSPLPRSVGVEEVEVDTWFLQHFHIWWRCAAVCSSSLSTRQVKTPKLVKHTRHRVLLALQRGSYNPLHLREKRHSWN